MPFAGTQSLLRKVMPDWCFTLLFKSARRGFRAYHRMLDELYYPFSYAYYVLKRDQPRAERIRAVSLIRPYTMVGRSGLFATYDVARELYRNNIAGAIVECGVARGGCSALMALAAASSRTGRKMWLFDSFEGLPEPAPIDEPAVAKKPGQNRHGSDLHTGYCLGTFEEVEWLLFTRLGLSRDNVFLVKGWFQDTLAKHKDRIGEISFLRIDADWYESTRCCLENLYDSVVSGGYVLIDDYDLPGCKKAVDDFLQQKGVQVKFILDDRGGAYFVKA